MRSDQKRHLAQEQTRVLFSEFSESQWCSINYSLSGATLPAAATAPADKLFVYNEPVEDLQGPEVPKINHLEEVYRKMMFTMSHNIFRLATPPM